MGFRSIRASRKPLLSRINIKKRLEYARQHRRCDWSRVLLNPIEHLWPFVLRGLEGQVFSGRDQLWSALQEGFAEVPASFVKSLYDSLPRRMEAVIVARGGPTRY